MHQRPLIAFAWIVVVAMGVFVRFSDLADRPMHADEATGARILAQRLEDGSYAFDPTHFHGPLLTAAAKPVARLRGEDSWRGLTEATVRIIPALAGSLLILAPLLFRRWLGNPGALAGALLISSSPLLVYYSRMFIHEMLLALSALLALAACLQHLRQPGRLTAFLAGLGIGLMWTAKETFVITLFAWAMAFVSTALFNRQPDWRQGMAKLYRTAGWLFAGLILTTLLLYTDFLRSPAGILDSVKTFLVYETVDGHEKPFPYYAHLLLWPKLQAGVLWWEGMVAAIALIAVVLHEKASSPPERLPFVRFLGIATAVHFLVYSCIGYKTPWLMVVPWAHACLLAGCLLAGLSGMSRAGRFACLCGLILVAGFQSHQALLASGRFAADSRNPYAYVPTTRDAARLGDWLVELNSAVQPQSIEPVAVVGSAYWPLPWYLRDFDSIGYWPAAGAFLEELPVAIVLPGQFEQCDGLLRESHVALPRGLRVDTPLMVYIRKDIWRAWMEEPAR